MKKNNPKKLVGLSSIEVIFASAILIFVLGAFAVLYLNFSKFYGRQQAEIKIGDSVRKTVKELKNAALQADHIVANHTFSATTYSTDEDTLVLEIPSVDGSGDVISGRYDYVAFYLTGSDFYKLVEADAASARSSGEDQLSDAVSALVFTYNNPNLTLADKIDVDLQMQTTSGGQTISQDLYQEIYLRNL